MNPLINREYYVEHACNHHLLKQPVWANCSTRGLNILWALRTCVYFESTASVLTINFTSFASYE